MSSVSTYSLAADRHWGMIPDCRPQIAIVLDSRDFAELRGRLAREGTFLAQAETRSGKLTRCPNCLRDVEKLQIRCVCGTARPPSGWVVTAAVSVTPSGAAPLSDEYTDELAFGDDESETYAAAGGYGEEGPTVVAPVPGSRARQTLEGEMVVPAPLPVPQPAAAIKLTPPPAAMAMPRGAREATPIPTPMPIPRNLGVSQGRPAQLPPPVQARPSVAVVSVSATPPIVEAPLPRQPAPARPPVNAPRWANGAAYAKMALFLVTCFSVSSFSILGVYVLRRSTDIVVAVAPPTQIPIHVSAIPERPPARIPTAPAVAPPVVVAVAPPAVPPPVPLEAAAAPTPTTPRVRTKAVAKPPAPVAAVVSAPVQTPEDATVYRAGGQDAVAGSLAEVRGTTPTTRAAEGPPARSAAAPSPDAKLGGTFVGKYLTKPASLQLELLPGGRIGGQLMVHEAGITTTTKLTGTYASGGGGVATFAVVEQGVSEPGVLSGTLDGQTAEGKVTGGGRIKGRFYVRR